LEKYAFCHSKVKMLFFHVFVFQHFLDLCSKNTIGSIKLWMKSFEGLSARVLIYIELQILRIAE